MSMSQKLIGACAARLGRRKRGDARVAAASEGAERWGQWSDKTLETFSSKVRDVPGDFAEIGVAYGRTFCRLTPLAVAQGKRAHAFDSFQGMGAPGEFDRQDPKGGAHVAGQFSVAGVENFRRLMDKKGLNRMDYDLWEGFTPRCFEIYRGPPMFSLAILDVDHYQPTVDGLAWLWPRISPQGCMLLDDFSVGWDLESTRAINAFLRASNDFQIIGLYNNQLMLRKVAP